MFSPDQLIWGAVDWENTSENHRRPRRGWWAAVREPQQVRSRRRLAPAPALISAQVIVDTPPSRSSERTAAGAHNLLAASMARNLYLTFCTGCELNRGGSPGARTAYMYAFGFTDNFAEPVLSGRRPNLTTEIHKWIDLSYRSYYYNSGRQNVLQSTSVLNS